MAQILIGRHIKLYKTKNLFTGIVESRDAAKDKDDSWGDVTNHYAK